MNRNKRKKQKLYEIWAFCPKGHFDIIGDDKDYYYCNTCKKSYSEDEIESGFECYYCGGEFHNDVWNDFNGHDACEKCAAEQQAIWDAQDEEEAFDKQIQILSAIPDIFVVRTAWILLWDSLMNGKDPLDYLDDWYDETMNDIQRIVTHVK